MVSEVILCQKEVKTSLFSTVCCSDAEQAALIEMGEEMRQNNVNYVRIGVSGELMLPGLMCHMS